MPGPQCEHVKPNGQRCKARAMGGGSRCWFHEPSTARDEARRRGGRTRNRPAPVLSPATADLELREPKDVVGLIGQSINQVRKGQLGTKEANAVGYLASVLLKALETAELLPRIEALERAHTERQALNGRASR
jgi:hypothetical protein